MTTCVMGNKANNRADVEEATLLEQSQDLDPPGGDGSSACLEQHGQEGLDLQDLRGLLQQQVVILEGQVQEIAPLHHKSQTQIRHQSAVTDLHRQHADACMLGLRLEADLS